MTYKPDWQHFAEAHTRNLYGAEETNGLVDAQAYHESIGPLQDQVSWTDPDLARITRLRLISDPNPRVDWDVSYCHGVLHDGTNVRVQLPFNHLPKARRNAMIVAYAKRDGVYAAGLGIFDAISTLC